MAGLLQWWLLSLKNSELTISICSCSFGPSAFSQRTNMNSKVKFCILHIDVCRRKLSNILIIISKMQVTMNTVVQTCCCSDMQFISLLVKLLHKGHNTFYKPINLYLYVYKSLLVYYTNDY